MRADQNRFNFASADEPLRANRLREGFTAEIPMPDAGGRSPKGPRFRTRAVDHVKKEITLEAVCTSCLQNPPSDYPEGGEWLCEDCWKRRLSKAERREILILLLLCVAVVVWGMWNR